MSDLGNKAIMAKNIQYYMDLNGKTRNDMCEALGVKYTTFTDWVKGKTYPRIDKIELMANYFGIEKSDLVEDKRHKNSKNNLSKDEKDVGKKVNELLSQLNNDSALMFNGEPIDDDTKELLKTSLENSVRIAKIIAKNKYTPKKYKH